ncbi:MAG TPA: DUF2235 domain-containing protein [Gammaproteobacteria bacterium]
MRNLIVCCDGTWNTADQRHDGVPVPTNVVRLFNALADTNPSGTQQLKYYHPGVGTEPGWWERALGGATGAGLDRNIMSAYHWLCRNYVANDRIFMFGFSRGAYTVRSLGGFIVACGLLALDGIPPEIAWARIEHVFRHGYRDRRETIEDWKRRKEKPAWRFHEVDGKELIPIHMIGVWDTVGALGIPDDLALLNLLDASDEHAFHDTALSDQVLHARHAVALDEIRASFQPTLWTGHHPDLKQVWFPGVHCDVGGGYRETGLSDGALRWMIEEATAQGLGFRDDMLEQIQPDPRGVLHDSYTDVFRLLPNKPRSVPRLDAPNGETPPYLHSSVIERRKCPPISDAPYRPTVPSLGVNESHEFTVHAINPWNETGLYLEPGATYRFEAEGQWMDRNIACGPDGTNDGDFQPAEIGHLLATALGEIETRFKKITGNDQANFRFTKRHDRIDGERVPWFCLIGAIANAGGVDDKGKPGEHETFKIGSGCEHTVRQEGYFYAYANDAWNFYENNRGSVKLKVTRLS